MAKTIGEKVFQSFDLCLASSNESGRFLEKLKVKNVKYFGNLKLTSEDKGNKQKNKNREILNNNKFWCAVSTHKGEDIFCLKTHLEIKKNHKNIITIIIPRHIDRAQSIELACKRYNLKSQILSDGELIQLGKEIIIINSYGVTSNYLSFCKSVFVGKSMIKKLESVSGQSPIEAAKLGCKIYYGPYVYNFQEIYELLNKYQISEKIYNENELSNKISNDLKEPTRINDEKVKMIDILGKQILNDTCAELNKILNK
jgi:3-deoxy-D-manno-octulosonic-acid transferase